jgi:hypothetical protein
MMDKKRIVNSRPQASDTDSIAALHESIMEHFDEEAQAIKTAKECSELAR